MHYNLVNSIYSRYSIDYTKPISKTKVSSLHCRYTSQRKQTNLEIQTTYYIRTQHIQKVTIHKTLL